MPDPDRMNHAVALAELVTYIEEARKGTLVAQVFGLADLAALCTMSVEQHGTIVAGCLHSTKPKNRILRYFPDLEPAQARPNITTCFHPGYWSSITKGVCADADDDAINLASAVSIVFRGSFHINCQEDYVPHSRQDWLV